MEPVETQEHYHPSCHSRAGSHWALTKPVTGRWDTELATSSTLVTSLCRKTGASPVSTHPGSGKKLPLPPSCLLPLPCGVTRSCKGVWEM